MVSTFITMTNTQYKVVYMTSNDRLIIDYSGLLVLVDRGPDGKWDLSGKPASPEEEAFIDANMPDKDKTETHLVRDK